HDLHGLERPLRHQLAGLVLDNQLARAGALRSRVLRMGMVDVVPRTVGKNDVREPELLVDRLAFLHGLEPARVAQRRILLVVPTNASKVAGIGIDQERRSQYRVEVWGGRPKDAVLGFRADDLGDGHSDRLAGPRGPAR